MMALILTIIPILAAIPGSVAVAADSIDQSTGDVPAGSFRAGGRAQSFTAGESGYLNQIDLHMIDYGSSGIVFTLRIYAGQSVSGTVLASSTFGSRNVPISTPG
ncbi:hypothetical protein AB4Z21_37015, partial [Paenibacillus sp. MCAF20]